MQFKSLFLGAAGIAAVTALSGCSTGSVKGEFKAPYSVSSTVGVGGVLAPTELKVDIDAKVNFPFDYFNTRNASGEVKIKDENLDLEFEGKIEYGLIEVSPTDEIVGLSSGINDSYFDVNINFVPAFDELLAASSSPDSTLDIAYFYGKLEGEDDDDNDDDSNNTSNDGFEIYLIDFPTIDVAQLLGGNAKPVTKFVSFATFVALSSELTYTKTHYIAAGFGNKGKLKWNIVPPVTN